VAPSDPHHLPGHITILVQSAPAGAHNIFALKHTSWGILMQRILYAPVIPAGITLGRITFLLLSAPDWLVCITLWALFAPALVYIIISDFGGVFDGGCSAEQVVSHVVIVI